MPQVLEVGTVPQRGMTRDEFIAAIEGSVLVPESAVGGVENLATIGLMKLTSAAPGAKSVAAVSGSEAAALLEDSHTLTASGAADLTKRTTVLNAASGSKTLTFGDGTADGQEHWFFMQDAASTAVWTLSGAANLFGFTGFEMSAISHSAGWRWKTAAGKWFYIGGNVLPTV